MTDEITPEPPSSESTPSDQQVAPASATPTPPVEVTPPAGSLANAGDAEAARAAARGDAIRRLGLRDPLPLTIIREYKGKQQKDANGAFATEAAQFAALGYTVTSQSWAPGQYGCGAFIIALLLFFILIGILIFIYMLFVKPAGTLTVTYTLTN